MTFFLLFLLENKVETSLCKGVALLSPVPGKNILYHWSEKKKNVHKIHIQNKSSITHPDILTLPQLMIPIHFCSSLLQNVLSFVKMVRKYQSQTESSFCNICNKRLK